VGCVLILLNDIYFDVFSLCGDSNNPVPHRNCVYAFVFLIQLKMKVWRLRPVLN